MAAAVRIAAPSRCCHIAVPLCQFVISKVLSCSAGVPAGAMDWTPWLALSSLEHLHLHVNPAWRAPLQPAAIQEMAAAWPRLTHLHLRLSPSDNATHALQHLVQFKALQSLSLTWLGQAGPSAGAAGAGALRNRRGSSLEVAAFNLAYLPKGLKVGGAHLGYVQCFVEQGHPHWVVSLICAGICAVSVILLHAVVNQGLSLYSR